METGEKMEKTVRNKIRINAPREKVWQVLSRVEYIKQWDDVPDSFGGEALYPGAVLEWEGHAKLTVTVFREPEEMRMRLFLPKVDLAPEKYEVYYTYRLEDAGGETLLELEVGDFAGLPDAQDYCDASLEFVTDGGQKIKELAENL